MALTRKQRVFINEYLKCWNATEAARRANYAHPNKQGPRLLVHVGISSEIDRRIKEQTMSADEVLIRLGHQARGSFANMVKLAGGLPMLDWEATLENGSIDTIKEITFREGSISVKLYDAQSALVHIGKHLGLFKDQVQIETWRDKVIELLKDGSVTPDDVRSELGDDLAVELFKSAGIPAITISETPSEG